MKRGWTRFWRCVDLAFLAMALVGGASAAVTQAAVSRRANETTLAGLRPGKDTLAEAVKRFGTTQRLSEEDGIAEWVGGCGEQTLVVEFDESKVIRTVTVSLSDSSTPHEGCNGSDTPAEAKLSLKRLSGGRGLALAQRQDSVLRLYGQPESSGPAEYKGKSAEQLFFSFDWAGSRVPQSMEVTCDKETGKVVKITLASSSL